MGTHFKNIFTLDHRLYVLVWFPLLALLSGCLDSVPTTSSTAQPSVTRTYSGPVAATADVLAFQTNLWDNLKDDNRCGSCHGTGGQSPSFARDDDVNLAYSEVLALVNLTTPAESRMVIKVAGGHNCWLDSNSACGDVITAYIAAWGSGTSTGAATQIELEAPVVKEVGASKNFTTTPPASYSAVHDLLVDYCSNCHVETAATPQAPFFADSDLSTSYEAAQSKINLDSPANSRLVVRLRDEFHNCWDPNDGTNVDCAAAANLMLTAITTLAESITPTIVDPSLVASKALKLTDGIVASGGSRDHSNIIALYEFKTGSGSTLFDTSGVEPELHLTLAGSEGLDYNWVGGWGVEFIGGKAQGSTTASQKLHDRIKTTNEYSIEAWVVPANVTQEERPIVSYSGGTTARNFTLGQTLYNYDFSHRSSATDANGQPTLSTADEDEQLQATQQHVVVTYDPINGRKIYVNGVWTEDADTESPGNFASWDNTFAFVLGNEVSNNRAWLGKLRLVAIYNHALPQSQITQNYQAGVGEKFFLLFNISTIVNIAASYLMVEVSQFDNYSYLFNQPMYINLNPNAAITAFNLKGMRIGMNGQEAVVGQAFRNLDTTVTSSQLTSDPRFAVPIQTLSSLGTIIAADKGPTGDEFFLTFERLGDQTHVVVEMDCIPLTDCPSTTTDLDPAAAIGIRTFEEIDATMATLTGVSRTNTGIKETYETIKQQLPTVEKIDGFLSSQQVAISQLAIEYCSALVEDTTLRGSFFPGFDFSAPATTAFSTSPTDKKALITGPLLSKMVGSNLTINPDTAAVATELDSLMDRLTSCGGGCAADRTKSVVKAACAAVLGSAALLIQ